MELMKRLLKEEKGQTATEYMVLLASVVAVLLGVAYGFNTFFKDGVDGMGANVQSKLSAGFGDG